MNRSGRFSGFELVHLLLLVTTAELVLNRLATRELRPVGDGVPPWWHQGLDHVGLFCQYFASTLAIGILGYQLWRMFRQRGGQLGVLRWVSLPAGVAFLLLVFISLVTSPGVRMSFWLETTFIVMVFLVVLGQLVRGGDLGAKIGVVLLAIPLFVHYYGPLSSLFISGDEARWSELPERVKLYGQWTILVFAMLSPYCFAPRPFMQSAARLSPLAVATFVGVIGVVILRQHYEVGMRLAQNGLGMDLGPGAPSRFLALYIVALSTMTWTLTSCLTAASVSRRDIGIGLSLLVVTGYGFAWPLQYLVCLVGLTTIGAAARRVAAEEREHSDALEFEPPPVADAVWNGYVDEVVRELIKRRKETCPGDEPLVDTKETAPGGEKRTDRALLHVRENRRPGFIDVPTQAVDLVRKPSEPVVTVIMARMYGLDVALHVERRLGSIVSIAVHCGYNGSRFPGNTSEDEVEPDWTLYARTEKVLGIGAHVEPPVTSAPVRKIGDEAFEQRFRVRDRGKLTEALLDEGMRARATALIDGWVAFWAEQGLMYCVHPGRGAPLDHPIPVTELAFRGSGALPAVDRLVTVIDLLASMTARALPPRDAPPLSKEAPETTGANAEAGKESESQSGPETEAGVESESQSGPETGDSPRD